MPFENIRRDSLKRICIRAPNWVGDLVMATPAFRAIRRHFPSARICLLVRQAVSGVLEAAPWIDEKVPYNTRSYAGPDGFAGCVRQLRRRRTELGIIFPNSFSSALMFFLAGVPRRVGYVRDSRRLLLTDPLARPSCGKQFTPTYMVDYYLRLCESMGIEPGSTQPELPFTARDMARGRLILQEAGIDPDAPLFLIHPGAGFGPSKRWSSEKFAALAQMLQSEFGAQVALIAGAGEAGTVGAILSASRSRIVDLSRCGLDLHLLKCVVALSRLLVTTDSGPRHYGVALGVPTVCIMGPTHPGYSTSDRSNDHVVRMPLPCSPCQRKRCKLDHRCMRSITAEMVFERCRAALNG